MIAQVIAGYSIVNLVIVAIVVAAVIAIGVVAIRQMGLNIPPFVQTIFWIVVVAVFGIFAIKVLLSLT